MEELEKLFLVDVAAEDVAAIVVEPVQGEGGFIVPTAGFLAALRRLCDKHGIVLIVDEVQTGFGRTGEMFAIEHDKIAPDLMTVGKSLCAGMPLSGVVGRADILDAAATGAIGAPTAATRCRAPRPSPSSRSSRSRGWSRHPAASGRRSRSASTGSSTGIRSWATPGAWGP